MEHSKGFGIFCLVGAALCWSCTPVVVKHFAGLVDQEVQNLFRYAVAAVALWVIVLTLFGHEALRAWRRWRAFLLPAAINCVFQVILVQAFYLKEIYPTFSSILAKSSVVFAVALAYLFFHDERQTIRSPRFILGAVLAVGGVLGVVLFDVKAAATATAAQRSDLAKGVPLILSQAFLWACYTLTMKRVVRHTRPLVGFAMVATYTTVFFIVLAAVRSRPAEFFGLSALNRILMLASGVLSISVAHSLYFRAVERLGVGVCASFMLITPLFIGIMSWAWHGERLAPAQILMAVVLLAGAYCVLIAGRKARTAQDANSIQQP